LRRTLQVGADPFSLRIVDLVVVGWLCAFGRQGSKPVPGEVTLAASESGAEVAALAS
jgi:hypothetical protein